MSRENVEVVRRVYEAAARRDAEAIFSLYHPDVEWDGSRSRWSEVMPEFGRWRGHDALRRFFRRYYEIWESLEDEIQELIDADDQVISVVTTRGRGRASGLDVEWTGNSGVWTIREGKVIRVVWFPSRDEALEAVPRLTMSHANVEVVRRVYDAVARRDRDAVLELYDPDVELDFSRSPFLTVFNRTIYRGHDGIRALFRERREEAWSDMVDKLDEVVGAGDRVIGVVTTRGRGRTSGAEVARSHAAVWTVRDGKVIRAVWFPTREEALEAANVGT